MRRRSSPLGFAGAVLLAATLLPAATACHYWGDERPNVVLVTLDTTRADALGAMGNARAQTPALDALAARGALFERAYASTPLTLPSHATILTGMDPRIHGVRDNGDLASWEDLETVAERLATRGYETAAFVAAFVLDSSFGLDRGFDLYDDEIERRGDPLSFAVPQRRGEVVTDRALEWLGERRRGPFFLWVHYYDPHTPHQPPPPFDQLESPYGAEVAYVDSQVARLLEGVERAAGGRETSIVVVGDHGESLGQHGEATHGVVVYDSTLHVPLIAAGPGFPAGARSREFVGTRDVAATILTAAGEQPFPRSQGVPLQSVLAGEGPAERTDYFASLGPWYRFGWARLAGVRNSRWKYTAEPEPVELYDVLADPGETVNRAAEEPEVVALLEALYRELRAEEREVESPSRSVSPEVEDKLAALGYVTAPQQYEPGEEPDPREFVGGVGLVDLARGLALQGRVAASIEALEILGGSPIVRVLALRSLANVYLAAGRTDDAVAAFQELVAKAPAREFSLGLARALLRDGRPAESLELLDQLPPELSGWRRVELLRGGALLELGRADEALELATSLLDREPGDDAALALASEARVALEPEGGAEPEIERLRALLASSGGVRPLPRTRGRLAGLLRAEDRDAEAVRVLEAAAVTTNAHRGMLAQIAADHGNLPKAAELYQAMLAERPSMLAPRRELAGLYDQMGKLGEAMALYDELVAADPGDAGLLVDRAATLLKAGRAARAEADLRKAVELDDSIPEGRLNLALIELRTGREQEAERDLLRAVELRPDYAKAHFHLAYLYSRRNDPRAAKHAELAAAAGSVLPAASPSSELTPPGVASEVGE